MTDLNEQLVCWYLKRWLDRKRAEAAARSHRLKQLDLLQNRPVELWWFEVLRHGRLGEVVLDDKPIGAKANREASALIPKLHVQRAYLRFRQARPDAPPWPVAARRLRELVRPCIIAERRIKGRRVWYFPPLDEMRASFRACTGVDVASAAISDNILIS